MSSAVNAYYSKLQEEGFLAALRERIGTERIDLERHPELQQKMERYKQFCERQRKRQLKRARRLKKREERKEKKRRKKEKRKQKEEEKRRRKKHNKKRRKHRDESSSSSSSSESESESDVKKRKRSTARRTTTSYSASDDDEAVRQEKRPRKEERDDTVGDEKGKKTKLAKRIKRETLEMELRKAALSALMEALEKENEATEGPSGATREAQGPRQDPTSPVSSTAARDDDDHEEATAPTRSGVINKNQTSNGEAAAQERGNLERELRLRALLMKAKSEEAKEMS